MCVAVDQAKVRVGWLAVVDFFFSSFYDISRVEGYFMLNPVYVYILNKLDLQIKCSKLSSFLNETELICVQID